MSANEKSRREASCDSGFTLDEYIMAQFGPDILLSEQYDRIYCKGLLSPEEELMLAVLEEAVSDVQRYRGARDRKDKTRFDEAEAWILANDREWIFSIENICEVLGFDPDYLRQGLLRWRERPFASNKRNDFILRQRLKKSRIRVAA